MAVDDAALVVRIVEFLRAIGLRVDEVAIDDATFLTGIRLVGGGIDVDVDRLPHASRRARRHPVPPHDPLAAGVTRP